MVKHLRQKKNTGKSLPTYERLNRIPRKILSPLKTMQIKRQGDHSAKKIRKL